MTLDRNNHGFFARFFILIVLFFIFPFPASAGYDYIDITSPFLKKVPIAIPRFKNISSLPKGDEIAVKSSDLLSNTLDFTGFFNLIEPGSFLEHPYKTGITSSRINFRDWTAIGAELLITGGTRVEGGKLVLEMRLFDTFKAKLLLGKRYRGNFTSQRRMIRKFADEVVYLLTGNHGIFNSKIAFISTGSGAKEIYICDFDGYNPKKITHTGHITLSPSWSQDGKWLAYTDYSKGNPDLYIKNLKEKKGVVVAHNGVNITPAWVPRQFSLAATLSMSGDSEIYMLTGRGKIIKRLTKSWGIDVSPTFSPDGGEMAFVSKRSGTPQIFIKDLHSGQVRRLTYDGRYNASPSWSPRGDMIAYESFENGVFDIYLIGVDGANEKRLTQDSGSNETPTWSPDGNLIAFSSTREGVSRIYVMTSRGSEQRRLLFIRGEQTEPNWSPSLVK